MRDACRISRRYAPLILIYVVVCCCTSVFTVASRYRTRSTTLAAMATNGERRYEIDVAQNRDGEIVRAETEIIVAEASEVSAQNRDGEVVRAEIEVEEAVGTDDERASATGERFRRVNTRGHDVEVVGAEGEEFREVLRAMEARAVRAEKAAAEVEEVLRATEAEVLATEARAVQAEKAVAEIEEVLRATEAEAAANRIAAKERDEAVDLIHQMRRDQSRQIADLERSFADAERDWKIELLQLKDDMRTSADEVLRVEKTEKARLCARVSKLERLVKSNEPNSTGSADERRNDGQDQESRSDRGSESEPPRKVDESPTSDLASLIRTLNLPRLHLFSGEKVNDTDGARQFVRDFEKYARLARWSEEEKLPQFEFHLQGRALRIFDSLTPEQKSTYESAKGALLKTLMPVQLESFKQSQFYARRQKDGEAVNDFAESLQRLFEEGFKELRVDPVLRDRMMLGQFEQGLLFRWKRHLKYPIGSFLDGVNQARMAEAVEDQLMLRRLWSESETSSQIDRNESRRGEDQSETCSENGSDSALKGNNYKKNKSHIRCYQCWEMGHYASECQNPRSGDDTKSKRGDDKSSARVAVVRDNPKKGTDKDENDCDTKRPFVSVQFGSVEVEALLDTGASANIISEEIFNQLDASNRQLMVPDRTLTDFSQQEIPILAQAKIDVSVNSRKAVIPVYIQKAAAFPCLLGIAAIRQLKLIELAPRVELKSRPSDRSKVRLISSRRIIPRYAESVAIKASFSSKDSSLLYEQETQLAEKSGRLSEDALLTPDGKGKAQVLLTNTTEVPQKVRENTVINYVEAGEVITKISKETVPDVAMILSKDTKKTDTLLRKIDDLKFSEGAGTEQDEEVMRVVVGRSSDLFSIDESDLGRKALAEVGKNLEEEEGRMSVPVAAIGVKSKSSTQKYERRARSESDLKTWKADPPEIAGQQRVPTTFPTTFPSIIDAVEGLYDEGRCEDAPSPTPGKM